MTETRKQAAMFVGATAVAFAFIAWRAELRFIPLDPGIDSYHYARMAVGYPDDRIMAPFRQRILVPLLVSALPFPVPWGFAVVSSGLLGVTFAGMYRLLTGWFTARVAWVGLAMLAVSGLVNAVITTPFQIDSAVLAVATIVFVCLEEKRWVVLLLVMPLGVAAHELCLVLLIPIAITAWREKKVPDAVIVGGLSVAMWWMLHRSGWVVPVNDRKNLLDAAHREEMVNWNAQGYGTVMGAVWGGIVGSFGVTWLLAPFGWKGGRRLLKDGAWMLPACAVACLTGSDWGRMFLPAMPVLISLACACVAASSEGPSPHRAVMGPDLVLGQGVIVEGDHGQLPLP